MISLSEFALDLVLRPNPEVIAKRLDQTTVLVDISTGRIFELNETGTRIWELLGQGLNMEQIVQHLQGQAADRTERLTLNMEKEAVVVRIITIVTLLYLPGTFVSVSNDHLWLCLRAIAYKLSRHSSVPML